MGAITLQTVQLLATTVAAILTIAGILWARIKWIPEKRRQAQELRRQFEEWCVSTPESKLKAAASVIDDDGGTAHEKLFEDWKTGKVK